MGHDGDPKVSTTVLVGIVGVILLLAILLFTVALFQDVERAETARKVYARPEAELSALHSEQYGKLNAYRWVNEQEQVVAIPIERAIELVVRDLKSGRLPTTIRAPASAAVASQPAGRGP